MRELCHLDEIESLDTDDGPLPRIVITEDVTDFDGYLVDVINADGSPGLRAGVANHDQWPEIATLLVGGGMVGGPDSAAMLTDLITAKAHYSVHHDIFVTTSNRLLSHRAKSWVKDTNPRLPSETAQIVGLFLRSLENYIYSAGSRFTKTTGHWGFYWVLARHKLPSMWRYFSACHYAGSLRNDDTFEIAESILQRCSRALQARDAIGEIFYDDELTYDTLGKMMYHFDYLALLLAGVFDAQARISHRALGLPKKKEQYSGFRRGQFQNELKHNPDATDIYTLITGDKFQFLTTMVYRLRNTIHGAGPQNRIGYESNTGAHVGFAELSREDGEAVWAAAEYLSSPDEWGLSREKLNGNYRYNIEPYDYASSLVYHCFNLIDEDAALTEIEKLFPVGAQIPKLSDGPPDDHVFGKDIRERLALLG